MVELQKQTNKNIQEKRLFREYPNSLVIYFLNFFLNFSKMLFFEEDFSISLNL